MTKRALRSSPAGGEVEMLRETAALAARDLKKWLRTPMQIIVTLITPLFWLLLFGQAFNLNRLAAPSGGTIDLRTIFGGAPTYFSFMAIGQLAVIIMFTTLFSGVGLIWDRRFGFLTKLQVAPIARSVIPLSRVASSVVRSMIQAAVVLIIAVSFSYIHGLNGLQFGSSFGVLPLLGLFGILVLLAAGFSALFVSLGLAIKNQETLFGLINLLNLPLMFTSSALFPTSLMPSWLSSIAKYNPITFAVDGARQLVFSTSVGSTHSIAIDVLGIAIFSVIMIAIGSALARRALMRT